MSSEGVAVRAGHEVLMEVYFYFTYCCWSMWDFWPAGQASPKPPTIAIILISYIIIKLLLIKKWGQSWTKPERERNILTYSASSWSNQSVRDHIHNPTFSSWLSNWHNKLECNKTLTRLERLAYWSIKKCCQCDTRSLFIFCLWINSFSDQKNQQKNDEN